MYPHHHKKPYSPPYQAQPTPNFRGQTPYSPPYQAQPTPTFRGQPPYQVQPTPTFRGQPPYNPPYQAQPTRSQPSNANSIRNPGYQQFQATNQPYGGNQQSQNLPYGGASHQDLRANTQNQYGSGLPYVVEDHSNPLYAESRASNHQQRAANNNLGNNKSEMNQPYDDVSSQRRINPHGNLSSTGMMSVQSGPSTNQPAKPFSNHFFNEDRSSSRPSLNNSFSNESSQERLALSREARNDPLQTGSSKPGEQPLPQRVYERKCRVEMVQEFLQCGILVLEGGDNRKEYCFFFKKDFLARNQMAGNIKMSLALPKGKELLANAKLADEGGRVPYLATTVWEDGADLDPNLMSKVFAPINSADLEKYKQLSLDLAWCLPKIIEDSGEGSVLSTRSTLKSVSPTINMPVHDLSPERFPGRFSRESTRRDPSPVPRTRSPVPRMRRSRSPMGRSRHSRSPIPRFSHSQARKRSPSPLHTGRDNAKRSRRDSTSPSRMAKLFSYDKTTKTGVLQHNQSTICFHINQFWVTYSKIGSLKFLEVFSSSDFPSIFPVGCRLEYTARKIPDYLGFDCQATSVWKSGENAPAFETPDLVEDLDLKLFDFKYKATGNPKNLVNPLKGTPDNTAVRGRVHEYFSLEMGFLKLEDEDGSVVLFHLNQVWASVQSLGFIPLKNCQKGTLEQKHLPIGTVVMVHKRRLPAHQNSQLHHQAIALWQTKADFPSPKLPSEYYKMYEHGDKRIHYDKRLKLLQDLDLHHDNFKKLSNLGFPSPDGFSLITPVPAVLNGLPQYWKAVIVAKVSQDFGIIRISHKASLSLTEETNVKMIHVMFHIEDVFDETGAPSFDSSLTMADLVSQEVDLTARSIANNCCSPDQLFRLQTDLKAAHNPNDVGTPLLQAIVVCLKANNGQPSNMLTTPQPTCLRSEPGTFHPQIKVTAFYLNLTLRLRLNIKLKNFLKLPDNLGLPYGSIVQPFLKKESLNEGSKLLELKKVDTNKSSRFIYGNFNPSSVKNEIKEAVLTNFPCTVKYLHQNQLHSTCGVLEVISGPGSFMGHKRSSYVFFEWSDYKFFSPKTYLASDLANVTPVESKDRFHVTAFYCNSNPLIPYIATSIWNENLRIELGQPIPSGSTFKEMESHLREKNRLIDDIIKTCSGNDVNFKTQKTVIDKSQSGASANIPTPCSFGAKCRSKDNCSFYHVEEKDGKPPCRNGSKCLNSKCWFEHPERRTRQIIDEIKETRKGEASSKTKEMEQIPDQGIWKHCRNGSKCLNPKCKFVHPEKGKDKNIEEEIEGKSMEARLGNEIEQTTNQSPPSKECAHQVFIEVPPSVGTVNTRKFQNAINKKWNGKVLVKKKSVLTQGQKIVEYIDNCVGVVEEVLNGYYGVITYSNEDSDKKVVRILFSINDVILPCSMDSKFKVLQSRALVKRPTTNLYKLLKKGDRVRFSAVMMITGTPNHAEISYFCVGLKQGVNKNNFVPFIPIKSSKSAFPAWKEQYEELLSCLTVTLFIKIKKKKKFSEARPIDMHPKKDYKLRPLEHRNTKGYLGQYSDNTNAPCTALTEDTVITIDDDDQEQTEEMKDASIPKSVLKFQVGKVVKIVNGQYGLAAIVHGKENSGEVYQVLFDITDVWLGDQTLDMLGKTLENVMKVGDHVMLHCIRVVQGECDSKRNIRFMATSLITADTLENLAKLQFPSQAAPIENISQIDQKKIDNFNTVVQILGKTKTLPNEEAILDNIAQENLTEKLNKLQAENYFVKDEDLEHLLTDEEKVNGEIYKQLYFCYHCKVFESFLDESKNKIEINKIYSKNHKRHILSECKDGCIEDGKSMFKELKTEFEQCLSEQTIYPAMINQREMIKNITTKQVIYECSLCQKQFANFFSHLKRNIHQNQVKFKFGRTMNTLKTPRNDSQIIKVELDTSKQYDSDGKYYRNAYICFHCQDSHHFNKFKSSNYQKESLWSKQCLKSHRKHFNFCINKDECLKEGKERMEELCHYFDEKVKVGDIIVIKEEKGIPANYHCKLCKVDFFKYNHVMYHKDFRPKDKEHLEAKKNALIEKELGAISNGLFFCFHCKKFEMTKREIWERKETQMHECHIKNCIDEDCVKNGEELFHKMQNVFERCLEDNKIEKCSEGNEGDPRFTCHISNCKSRMNSFLHVHKMHPLIVEEYTAEVKLIAEFENGIKNGDIKLWKETSYCCLHCASIFYKPQFPKRMWYLKHLKGKFHIAHMEKCKNQEDCIKEGEETAKTKDLVREPMKEGYIVKVKTEDNSCLWKCLHCEVNFKTKNHLESDSHIQHMKDCGLKCWNERQSIAEEKERLKEHAKLELHKQLSCKSAIRLFNSNLYHCFHCKVRNVEISHFSDPFHTNHIKNCGTKMEDCSENPTYNKDIAFLVGKRDIIQFPDKKSLEEEEYDNTIHERFFCFHCQIGFSSRLHISKSHKQHMQLNICTQKCKMIIYHGTAPVIRDRKTSCMVCNDKASKYMSREVCDIHMKSSSHKRAIVDKLRKSEKEVEDAVDVPQFLKITNPSDEAPLVEIEDSDDEMEDSPETEKLPNVVINQNGYVLILLNENCAIGRFDYKLYVIEKDEWIDKQLNVLFDTKSLLVDKDDDPIATLTGVISPGDKIRFHGIRLQREVKKVGDVVQYYSDCVLHGDKCKSKELQFTNSYQKWLRDEIRLKATPIWKKRKNELEDGFEAIEKSKDEVLNVQMESSFASYKGTVIHTDSTLSIVQIDRENKASVFALYINSRKVAQSQVGSKSRLLQQMAKDALRLNQSVLLHCVLVDPLGPIQYLTTSIWADREGVEKPEVVPFDDVFEKVVEKFRQLVPTVVYVDQVWLSCPRKMREDLTLELFTPSQVRKIIMAYTAALQKHKSDKKAYFDMQEIAKEAKLTENIHFVQAFLMILGDQCLEAEVDSGGLANKGIKLKKVFVNSAQVELVKKEGLQSLMTVLPKCKEARIFWKIPTEWRVEKAITKLDLGEKWDEKDDSMLVVGFFEHGYNWTKIQKDEQLGLEGKITGDSGEVREQVKMRLKQMITMINFRGRISSAALDISTEGEGDDTESDLENYMDEDERKSLATLKEKTFEMEDEVFLDCGDGEGRKKTVLDFIEIEESDTEDMEENELNITSCSSTAVITIENDEDANVEMDEEDVEDEKDIEEEMMAQIDRDIKAIEDEFREEEESK